LFSSSDVDTHSLKRNCLSTIRLEPILACRAPFYGSPSNDCSLYHTSYANLTSSRLSTAYASLVSYATICSLAAHTPFPEASLHTPICRLHHPVAACVTTTCTTRRTVQPLVIQPSALSLPHVTCNYRNHGPRLKYALYAAAIKNCNLEPPFRNVLLFPATLLTSISLDSPAHRQHYGQSATGNTFLRTDFRANTFTSSMVRRTTYSRLDHLMRIHQGCISLLREATRIS